MKKGLSIDFSNVIEKWGDVVKIFRRNSTGSARVRRWTQNRRQAGRGKISASGALNASVSGARRIFRFGGNHLSKATGSFIF